MSTFESILTSTTRLDDIKDVPPLPHGTYLALVDGPHQMIEARNPNPSTGVKTKGAEIQLRFLQPRDDVDADALQAHLAAANRTALREVTMKHTFWDSPYLESSLRDFFRNALGFDGDSTIKENFGNLPGSQLLVTVVNKPFTTQGGEMKLRAEIAGFGRAE